MEGSRADGPCPTGPLVERQHVDLTTLQGVKPPLQLLGRRLPHVQEATNADAEVLAIGSLEVEAALVHPNGPAFLGDDAVDMRRQRSETPLATGDGQVIDIACVRQPVLATERRKSSIKVSEHQVAQSDARWRALGQFVVHRADVGNETCMPLGEAHVDERLHHAPSGHGGKEPSDVAMEQDRTVLMCRDSLQDTAPRAAVGCALAIQDGEHFLIQPTLELLQATARYPQPPLFPVSGDGRVGPAVRFGANAPTPGTYGRFKRRRK